MVAALILLDQTTTLSTLLPMHGGTQVQHLLAISVLRAAIIVFVPAGLAIPTSQLVAVGTGAVHIVLLE